MRGIQGGNEVNFANIPENAIAPVPLYPATAPLATTAVNVARKLAVPELRPGGGVGGGGDAVVSGPGALVPHGVHGELADGPELLLELRDTIGIVSSLDLLGVRFLAVETVRGEARQREIGVRVALGAAPGAVVALMLRRGMAPVAIGEAREMVRGHGVPTVALTPCVPDAMLMSSIVRPVKRVIASCWKISSELPSAAIPVSRPPASLTVANPPPDAMMPSGCSRPLPTRNSPRCRRTPSSCRRCRTA